MTSEYLTFVRKLYVFDFVLAHQLFQHPDQLFDED